MLQELLKNTTFRSNVRTFYVENKDTIIDILLFGSVIRGKEKPADIDILIIAKEQKGILDLGHTLRIRLEKKGFHVSVTMKTYETLFDPAFIAREAFLTEAYSIVLNKFISNGLGYESLVLFRYALKGKSKSERMRFYYSLYGRNEGKGILQRLNALKFSDTIIAAPVENSEEIKAFFDHWNINYLEIPALIPIRIMKAKKL